MKVTDLENATKLKARFDRITAKQKAIEEPKHVTVSVDNFKFDLNEANRARILAVLSNQLAMEHATCAAQAIDLGLEFE